MRLGERQFKVNSYLFNRFLPGEVDFKLATELWKRNCFLPGGVGFTSFATELWKRNCFLPGVTDFKFETEL